MNKRNIAISQPKMGEEEWLALKEPLETGWITSGPKVREFETEFAKQHQVKHAIAVTSCTTALHLALVALDIKSGDEVIVPAFTWISTANVVEYCGGKVVFCDIDPITFNLNPNKLENLITANTKAIIAVHLFGLCADMDAIKAISGKIPIVEDGACAAGAAYKKIPAGGLGDLGCFSFHPRKSVTTGEGGMVTTNSDKLAEKVQILRNHGASISEEQRHNGAQPYILPDFNILGFNYRMTDLQGALGVVQLKKLESFISFRSKWAKFYQLELSQIDWIQCPTVSKEYKHGWQSFVCLIDEEIAPHSRNTIMKKLQEVGISTRPGTHAVHMLDYYKSKYTLSSDDFFGAKTANDKSMSIPLHNMMNEQDFQYVVNQLKALQ